MPYGLCLMGPSRMGPCRMGQYLMCQCLMGHAVLAHAVWADALWAHAVWAAPYGPMPYGQRLMGPCRMGSALWAHAVWAAPYGPMPYGPVPCRPFSHPSKLSRCCIKACSAVSFRSTPVVSSPTTPWHDGMQWSVRRRPTTLLLSSSAQRSWPTKPEYLLTVFVGTKVMAYKARMIESKNSGLCATMPWPMPYRLCLGLCLGLCLSLCLTAYAFRPMP